MTQQHRVVFVLHRDDLTGTPEAFADEKDHLVNVLAGKDEYVSGRGIEGIRDSWLVFETPEQEDQPTGDRTVEDRSLSRAPALRRC